MRPEIEKVILQGIHHNYEEWDSELGVGHMEHEEWIALTKNIEERGLSKAEAAMLVMNLGWYDLEGTYSFISYALHGSSRETREFVLRINRKSDALRSMKPGMTHRVRISLDCGVLFSTLSGETDDWMGELPVDILTDGDFRFVLAAARWWSLGTLSEERKDRISAVLRKNCAVRPEDWFSEDELEDVAVFLQEHDNKELVFSSAAS